MCSVSIMCLFFFNDTATTEIYTLSLHDALPILHGPDDARSHDVWRPGTRLRLPLLRRSSSSQRRLRRRGCWQRRPDPDRKSTRLNSSHANISYAVFCLKKKKIPRQSLHITFATP